MIVRLHASLFGVLALALFSAACAPSATTEAPPPTAIPPTEVLPTATPTLVPVTLAGPEAGERMSWLDGSVLVFVPSGEFKMGTGVGDAPEHSVSVDDFWITRTKVTNSMFTQCASVGACTPPAQELGAPVYTNPDYASHPVVGVTWEQAQAYCGWAQGRLPTEAEWEKSARGTAGASYPWGEETPSCDLLNFASCLGHTTDVTDYESGASPYGALDMAGNAFEWIGDWYDEAYYSSAPLSNPTGPETGQYRVVRGSSFETDPDQVLSGLRHYAASVYHSRDTGFRCVVTDPKPLAPYCQLSAFIPSGQVAAGACQTPLVEERGQYCLNNYEYATIYLPDGAVFQSQHKEIECADTVVDGQRRITCRGPRAREITGEITVCNPTCSTSPDVSGAQPACAPGYTLAPGTAECNYTPITGQPGVAGCPAGYASVDRGAEKSCALGLGADGLCLQGLYLDSLYGACVPPGGGAEIPYGLDNPDLAAQTYQGCATGYTYDSTFQCCQADAGGTYPGCSPGATFDSAAGACSPGGVKLSGPGCVELSLTLLKCGEAVDVCKRIDSEAHCIKAGYACRWIEAESVCVLK